MLTSYTVAPHDHNDAGEHMMMMVMMMMLSHHRYLGTDTPNDTQIQPEGYKTLQSFPGLHTAHVPFDMKVNGRMLDQMASQQQQ